MATMNRKIIAVIVTYQSNIDILKKLLQSLTNQVDSIIIVDNGSVNDIALLVSQFSLKRISTRLLGKNMGVAFAQNAGIQEAMKKGATHILLMDHDSIPQPSMVSSLASAEEALTRKGEKVSAVGPRYEFPGTNVSSFFVRFGLLRFKKIYCTDENKPEYIPVDFLISSGCLIPVKALSEIGLMDDTLFIDHVDTEWFLRARSKGYSSFGVCNAVMYHSLGDYLFDFWFGKKRTLPVHSPLRQYYIFRNSFLLYRRSYVSRKWMINDIIRLFLMFVFFSFKISPRVKHVQMMSKGVYDGLRGKSGKII